MLSRVVYKKRRGRRLLTALATVFLLSGLFVFGGTVLAVHDLDFQLDGNALATCPPAPDTGFCTTDQQDWADIFTVANAAGSQSVTKNTPITTANGTFTNASFSRDFRTGSSTPVCKTDPALSSTSTSFCTYDSTTFATGSKDTLEINTGWACNADNNVNSKIDIMNAYSASFTETSSGHKLLYFGLEKNKDNGTNNAGFWFLQGDASCDASGGGHPSFSGTHTLGDVLVVAEYSTGGGVGNVTAYRWVGGTTPLTQIANAVAPLADCKVRTAGDALCATTNSGAKQFNGNITTPWLTSDATLGVGTTVVPPDFFEGGIDLTQAFQESGGGTAPSCFNTFIADTRSSTALTATLFDFARGQLGECKSELSTTANAAASREIEADGSITSGTDSANLKVTGTATWGGNLTFYLCGPNVTTCDTTGYVVTSQTVANTDGDPDCGANCNYTSGTVDVTSAAGTGKYCWHAKFTPDAPSLAAGVKAAEDNGDNECFTITPKTPTLTTTASCLSTPCVLGSTLNDSATLTGTANNPDPANPGSDADFPTIGGGTIAADSNITWAVYGPASDGSAQCTTPIAGAPTPSFIAVSGNNTYGPVAYTTLSTGRVGKYTFAASYPGEGPNTNAASGVACDVTGGNGEQVTVIGSATSSSLQGWLPNDRITLNSTAGTTLNGTLTATLYKGVFGGTAAACTVGTGVATGYSKSFTIATATNTTAVFTDNTTFFVGVNPATGVAGGTDGTYFWLIQYVDNSLTSPADRCETSTISHNDG